MLSYPAIFALFIALWNILTLFNYSEDQKQISLDRASQNIALAIFAEALCQTSLSSLSWVIILPGLVIVMLLCVYNAKYLFSHV